MGKAWVYHRDGSSQVAEAEDVPALLESDDWADTPAAFAEGGEKYRPSADADGDGQIETHELQALLDGAGVEYDKRWGVKKLMALATEKGLVNGEPHSA